MATALDLTNQRFGRLVALERAESRNKKTYWLCRCDCGKEKEVQTSHLRSGLIQSCGCINSTTSKEHYDYCLYCGKKLVNKQKKYCSISCQQKYQNADKIKMWQEGESNGLVGKSQLSEIIRNYLLEKAGYKCEICGWGEINIFSNTSPLEIHHKDGNYLNNTEDNLQVLCPNCHSLTETYRGHNKTGRPDRQQYAQRSF